MSAVDNLPEQVYSRPGTDVARVQESGGGLDASDILLPRMKIGQAISKVVSDDPTLYAAIYVLTSRDDMEPTVLAPAPAKGEQVGKDVRFYILGDPIKGWSWKPATEGGDWRGSEYPDLRQVEGQDPRKVRRTYDYLIVLPDYPMLPARFLMHGAWGGQAAKTINTQLLLARQKGIESHTIAFKVAARKTSSPQGGQERPYAQAIVGLDKVAAKDKQADLELVEGFIGLVGSNLRSVEDEDTVQGSTATATDAPSLG